MREIGWDNLHAVLALDVDPAQQQFVASNAVSIAEAHFNPGAWFRAVYADDVLVGFVMLFDPTIPGAIASDPVEPTDMVLWRLMVDRRYQRQGLGRRILDAVREHIASLGRFRRLLTSYVPGPGDPKASISRTASPRPGVTGTTARKSRLPCGCDGILARGTCLQAMP